MDLTPWADTVKTLSGAIVGAAISLWIQSRTVEEQRRKDRLERIASLLYEADRVCINVRQLMADKAQFADYPAIDSIFTSRATEIDAAVAALGHHAQYLELTNNSLPLALRIVVLRATAGLLRDAASEHLGAPTSREATEVLDGRFEDFDDARDRLVRLVQPAVKARPDFSFSGVMRRVSKSPRWDAKPRRKPSKI